MKKANVSEYELLTEYFTSVRTHAVGTKYGLLELSKSTIDDFMDCVDKENRLVMTNFELDQYNKRLETLKSVFSFTLFIHDFCEEEIKKFKKAVSQLTSVNEDDKMN